MRALCLTLLLLPLHVLAGDLKLMNISAQQGGDRFNLQVNIREEGSSGGDDYDYYGGAGTTFDAVGLYDFVRVSPATSFSISAKRNGFLLIGDFKPETQYKVTIKAGLKASNGSKLTEESSQETTTGSFKPRFSFKTKARYMPGSLQGSIPWDAVNVDKVELEVRQVFAQNLHQFLSQGESANEAVSELIKTIPLTIKAKKNRVASGTFSLADLDTLGQGVFVVVAKSPKPDESAVAVEPTEEMVTGEEGEEFVSSSPRRHQVQYDTTTLVVTNLSVVTKRGANEARVWVMQTKDLIPVSGAQVDLVAMSNRKLDSCKTSGGQAECSLAWKKSEQTTPYAVIVRSGKDMTYVRFQDLTLPNDAFQGGKRDYNSANGGLDAYVYSERDLYRPGEKVQLAVMVRNQKFEVLPKLPVRWTITNPRGKVVRESVSDTSELGVAHSEFQSSPASDTGKYKVTVASGKNVLHETSVLIEEFVPERIGLKIHPGREVNVAQEKVSFTIAANYLFGPPVKDGKFRISCSLKPAFSEIPNRAEYKTGVYSKEPRASIKLESHEGSLDNKGAAKEFCDLTGRNQGLTDALELSAKVEVTEAGSGRATTKFGKAYVAPSDTLIGLKSEGSKDRSVRVRGGLFDFKGTLKNQTAKIKLKLLNVREHWHYSYGGYDSWQVEEIITPTAVEKLIDVTGGSFDASLDVPQDMWGKWIVRATDLKSGYTADVMMGYVGWYYDRNQAGGPGMRAPEPSALKVEVSKTEASPGDKLEAAVNVPFAGRLLITFETDKVLESRWLEVKKPGLVKTELRVPDALPNVYITALLLKDPRESGGKRFMPARAWGARSVAIVPAEHRMAVQVNLPQITESRKTVTVVLNNEKKAQAEYSLALVDEGILQMTDFKSPDPVKRFFEARAMGVLSAESLGWTVAIDGPSGKNPGGDQAKSGTQKNMPVRLVSFWYPNIKSDSSGRAEVKIPLPPFQGKLRVMAVASAKSRMGSFSGEMTVRDPLVLQPTLPRFLTQGDQFQFPVSVTNMSGKEQNVTVDVNTGALVKLAKTKQTVVIPNNQARVLSFDAMVTGVTGYAQISVTTTSADGKLKSIENFDLPVKPSGVEQTIRISLDTSQPNVVLAKHIPADWRTDYMRFEASVSHMPYLNQMSHLSSLIHYPYGCVEQTTSATLPLLTLGDLLKWVDPKAARSDEIKEMVRRGIARVLSMQTASGGFGYWPGAGDPNPWGTAYATFMLLDAKKLGYEVPAGALKNALDYLETYARNSRYSLASTGRQQSNAEPFVIYVLAKGGRAVTQELRDAIHEFKPVQSGGWNGVRGENYFLLAASAKLLGDKKSLQTLADESVYAIQLTGARDDYDTYWSHMRSDGMRLAILEDVSPKHTALNTLAERVAAALAKSKVHYSTQDIAWSVLALGKRLQGLSKVAPERLKKAGLMVNGKKVDKSFEVSGAPGFAFSGPNLHQAGLKLTDVPPDKGLYFYVKATGFTKTPPVSNGKLSVSRQFYKRDGTGIDPKAIKQGDTVFVMLSVSNSTGEKINNIAVVDRLPAGFEIENPRLGQSEKLEFMNDAYQAEYQDMRDDRIQVFGDLDPNKTVYIYYSARAVTKGQFVAPAAFVEAMYDPESFDYDADQPIQILDLGSK